jgi:hypothetical protein
LWVEVHILPKDTIETEYINCHPHTGFLPHFPAHEVTNGGILDSGSRAARPE